MFIPLHSVPITGCLKQSELEQLQDWIPPYDLRDKEQLQETGYDEQAAIGEEWRNFLPHLFDQPFHPTKFKVCITVQNCLILIL